MMVDLQPLSCQRSEFSIPAGACYLNSAYMGPLPRAVQQAGMQALQLKAFPAQIAAADFFVPADRVRQQCARLVGADAENIALISTAAYGVATVAKQVRAARGQNIVMLGEQFPSNVYAWREFRARGVEIRTVAAPAADSTADDRTRRWNTAILEAIDRDTAVVAVETAHWTDGTLFDLAAIGKRAREVGAWFVVDGTQTVGAMPFELDAIKPDALIVHSYKAMLCNYGLGFAYFSERFADGTPLEESWLTRAGSENFARLVQYQDEYAPGMRRYDSSTRSNPVLIHMLDAAARLLIEWQPARIQHYCLKIAREFARQVQSIGFGIAGEGERAGNIFGLRAPKGTDLERLRGLLAQRDIHVSVRGDAIRVSPHVYNDESDLARLAEVLTTG